VREISIPGSLTQMRSRIGALAWILGTAQFFVAHVITQLSWPTPYSWAANNISDLGNLHCQIWDETRPRYVCSPLHNVMNTAVLVEGVLIIFGLLLTMACWKRGFLGWSGRVLLLIDGVGYLLVGLKPADLDENLHVLGALLIMGAGNLGLLLAGFSLRTRALRIFSLATAAVSTTAGVLFFSQVDVGIGLGGTERVAVFALEFWTVVVGVWLLTRYQVDRPRTQSGSDRSYGPPPDRAPDAAPGNMHSRTGHGVPK
jgi:hypothetical membrane protein